MPFQRGQHRIHVVIAVDRAVPNSGPHRNVVNSLNALSAREDVDVTLLTEKVDQTQPFATAGNLEIVLGFAPHRALALLRNLALIVKYAREADVIYVPSGLHSFLYAWALKGRAALVAGPNVSGIPGLMRREHPSPLMTSHMSSRWLAMSDVWQRMLLRSGSDPDKVVTVPHSVDCERFSPQFRTPVIWESLGLPACSQKVVFMGHLEKELKGARHVVDAHQSLVANGWDVDLVLIGAGDSYSGMPRVYHTGFVEGRLLSEYLASADILVGASSWETFWFAPLEAMASGIPVLVTPVGAVTQMIPVEGDGGFLLDGVVINGKHSADAAAIIARRLIDVLSDPQRLVTAGQRAREHAQHEFSNTRLGDRLVRVFREAADSLT